MFAKKKIFFRFFEPLPWVGIGCCQIGLVWFVRGGRDEQSIGLSFPMERRA